MATSKPDQIDATHLGISKAKLPLIAFVCAGCKVLDSKILLTADFDNSIVKK